MLPAPSVITQVSAQKTGSLLQMQRFYFSLILIKKEMEKLY